MRRRSRQSTWQQRRIWQNIWRTITLSIKAGEGGKAFGSVSSKEIAKAIKDQLNLDIDKKKLVLPEPIKTFGTHEVPIKLHKEVTGKLAVKVVEA